ncbi:MAG: hypothetical protein ACYC5X_10915 [Syntrophales bacterium]
MNKDYYEVVIEGHLELAKGFVMGFLAGRGIEGSAFFDEACHIAGEYEAGPLLRLISAHNNVSTLIVGSGLYDLLVAALSRHPQVIALSIKKVRRVLSAAFTCQFRTYSREMSDKIKEILSCVPEGVDGASGFELHEKIDPEGKGHEFFTPLHDYELAGKGRISGSVKGVLDLYHQLGRFEVVELRELELTFGETL